MAPDLPPYFNFSPVFRGAEYNPPWGMRSIATVKIKQKIYLQLFQFEGFFYSWQNQIIVNQSWGEIFLQEGEIEENIDWFRNAQKFQIWLRWILDFSYFCVVSSFSRFSSLASNVDISSMDFSLSWVMCSC